MDIQPPPDYYPLQPSEYPQIPTTTPTATLEKLHASWASRNIEEFRDILDSQNSSSEPFEICELHEIMMEAINLDEVQFIKELLDHGMPVNALHALEAIDLERKDILEIFLQVGWNINEPLGKLKPPVLGYAIEDEDMVAWFLDHGADPNRQCVIDLTPLSLAVESAPISVIRLMLSRGGDTRKGELLHYAVERKSDNIPVLRLLIEHGADINSIMYADHDPSWALFSFMGLGAPLHKAAKLGKVDVVRYLLSEGADLSIRDGKGRTALEYAQTLNQSQVIQVLEKGN